MDMLGIKRRFLPVSRRPEKTRYVLPEVPRERRNPVEHIYQRVYGHKPGVPCHEPELATKFESVFGKPYVVELEPPTAEFQSTTSLQNIANSYQEKSPTQAFKGAAVQNNVKPTSPTNAVQESFVDAGSAQLSGHALTDLKVQETHRKEKANFSPFDVLGAISNNMGTTFQNSARSRPIDACGRPRLSENERHRRETEARMQALEVERVHQMDKANQKIKAAKHQKWLDSFGNFEGAAQAERLEKQRWLERKERERVNMKAPNISKTHESLTKKQKDYNNDMECIDPDHFLLESTHTMSNVPSVPYEIYGGKKPSFWRRVLKKFESRKCRSLSEESISSLDQSTTNSAQTKHPRVHSQSKIKQQIPNEFLSKVDMRNAPYLEEFEPSMNPTQDPAEKVDLWLNSNSGYVGGIMDEYNVTDNEQGNTGQGSVENQSMSGNPEIPQNEELHHVEPAQPRQSMPATDASSMEHVLAREGKELLQEIKRVFPASFLTAADFLEEFNQNWNPISEENIESLRETFECERFRNVLEPLLTLVQNKNPKRFGRNSNIPPIQNIHELLPSFLSQFSPLKTRGDGNCFYNAISKSLFGNEDFADSLRLLLVEKLLFDPTVKDGLVRLSNFVGEGFSYLNYSQVLHTGLHEWNDEVVTVIMTGVLKRPIHVYSPFSSEMRNIYRTSDELDTAFRTKQEGLSRHHRFLYYEEDANRMPISIRHTEDSSHYEVLYKVPGASVSNLFKPFTEPMELMKQGRQMNDIPAELTGTAGSACPNSEAIPVISEILVPETSAGIAESLNSSESFIEPEIANVVGPARDSVERTCSTCNSDTIKRSTRRRSVESDPNFVLEAKRLAEMNGLTHSVGPGNVLCDPCRLKIRKNTKSLAGQKRSSGSLAECVEKLSISETGPSIISGSPHQKKCVEENDHSLPMSALPRILNKCIVCKSSSARAVIPEPVVAATYARHRFLIPYGSKCCKKHLQLDGKELNHESIDILKSRNMEDTSELSTESVMSLLDDISEIANNPPSILENVSTTSKDYQTLTGLSKEKFEKLLTYVDSDLRNTTTRSPRDALGMFLMKLRMNISQDAIGVMFNTSQSNISKVFDKVLNLLEESFVPKYLGYDHISRENYIKEHGTILSRILLGTACDVAIVILDGTYLYIQKSSNFKLQKETYSGHKFRNLVKPMMIVAPDGYILAVEGLYLGKNNDATIFKKMTASDDGFASFFKENDTIVWDRGFRDATEVAKKFGLDTCMPNFLAKGLKQHSTEEANQARLVTKIRWIVESVNGRIKNVFPFFDGVVENSYLPKLEKIFKVSCAILNAFHPALRSDRMDDAKVATEMRERLEMSNLLQSKILSEKLLQRRVVWEAVTHESLEDFPELTLDELREFTMGTYQIRMAPSYSASHLDPNGDYALFFHQQENNLLRIKIDSRHSGSTAHQSWIQYEPNGSGVKAILGWYCTCKCGARNIGSCSHVASVIWHLGYGRWQPIIRIPASKQAASVRNAEALSSDEE